MIDNHVISLTLIAIFITQLWLVWLVSDGVHKTSFVC